MESETEFQEMSEQFKRYYEKIDATLAPVV